MNDGPGAEHPSDCSDLSKPILLAELYRAADQDESLAVQAFTSALSPSQRTRARDIGLALVRAVRTRAGERTYLDAFLQEFGLSSEEGVALMCLAESLLRIPDDATADRLIAEKLAGGGWTAHAGASESLFVNASTWGLMLTGRLIDLPPPLRANPVGWLRGLVQRVSEPIVRRALRAAMRLMGREFVIGRDIAEALARSRRERELNLCSFDMLGEGARTDRDARHYLEAYGQAIRAIGEANRSGRSWPADPHSISSISIKLSALDARYELTQRERVCERLLPRALELARLAASEGLALTIDAEEADRLEISLQIFEALARDPETGAWPGLGLAVQAYGRRARVVIDWVRALARATRRLIAVRLVKGAYWDSEIKRAQERGLSAYPVYTRKLSTDLAYIACAQRLFQAGPALYPQFATHNAHTIGAVMAMRPTGARFEFQRLHGMGQLVYHEAQRTLGDFPTVRVYAPVGQHEELLAYLVRRLLENGANTSFVNRFMDERVAPELIVADPIEQLAALEAIPHPQIALPSNLYGVARRNSRGLDLGESRAIDALENAVTASVSASRNTSFSIIRRTSVHRIMNPADRRECVGEVAFATAGDAARSLEVASRAQRAWNATAVDERAACLERASDALERQRERLVALLVREAGKTLADAIAEIRESVDFCRYYACEARRVFGAPIDLPGPTGESNRLELEGRGVFACISPWNFPLAIFTGQIAAALAAGNAAIAKPAEQAPLIAAAMTGILHQAGVPRDVLQCLAMKGRAFGEAALSHPALSGVVFTGSTSTAQWLNRALAAREGAILPLIAETGGLNAMIVDSSALPEQVVDDVITSAFSSAGQRCSALRLLCLQEEVADRTIEMIIGAMDELVIGDPSDPATDVGPVISEQAATSL